MINTATTASIMVGIAIVLPVLSRAAPKIDRKEVLTRTGVKLLSEEDKSLLKLKMTRAGLDLAPEYFQGIRTGLTGLSLLICVVLSLLTPKMFLLAIFVPAVYILPNIWLNSRIEARKYEFQSKLDDFVMYLSTALSSSPELTTALQEAGVSTGGVYQEEMERVIKETLSGRNLTDALLDMSQRADVEGLNSLVSIINQIHTYGGAVTEKMQQYADKLREGKRYEIMDQVGKLSIKLIFVVMIFMLIPVLMVIGYPAVCSLTGAL